MILIKQTDVYAPQYLGVKDVLVCGGRIEAVEDSIEPNLLSCKVIDGKGKKLVPGIIDPHVHITGGGGEGSFHTQVPPVSLSELLNGGVTTVVGLLGTDGISRSVENLVAKTKALCEEGITAYACTGSYGYPSTTLTGDIRKDLMFVKEIIGVKLAISDHRAPNVTVDELIRLASDARVSGMLSGKCGMLVLHMGNADSALSLVREALDKTTIPVKIFHPTHVTRAPKLLQEAFDFAKQGGYIDMTCGTERGKRTAEYIMKAKEQGVPLNRITMSSDGMGSWSKYDQEGNLIQIGYSAVDTIYQELKAMVQDYKMPLEEALCFMTSNTAHALEIFPKKGCIRAGSDADLLLLEGDLSLDGVIANGNIMMENHSLLKKGTYDK